MAQQTPSPPPFPVPQNTPFTSRPQTSQTPRFIKNPSLTTLLRNLLPTTNLVQPPHKPRSQTQATQISSLALHPTLEVVLHILNHDLPSAHFLVRHMQAAPAVEGMLLHGILHRCEGDFNNARAWISDVGDICAGWAAKKRGEEKLEEGICKDAGLEGEKDGLLGFVYGGDVDEGGKRAERLIGDVESFRTSGGRDGDAEGIEGRIREEMKSVLEWCARKFGDGEWVDASSAWVRPGEEIRKTGEDMVSGGKGFRKF